MLSLIFSDTSHYARPAVLALADGTVFHGYAFGAKGHTVAEIVFNTSMTGYQEILSDPSYAGQIVTLTYPHAGNTGVNPEDDESGAAQVAGLIVRDNALLMSSFRATRSLSDYLKAHDIVAITGIDTRSLTRLIREKGRLVGCIWEGDDVAAALEQARAYAASAQDSDAARVATDSAYEWSEGPWTLGGGFEQPDTPGQKHVVVVDFGVKKSILRQLVARQCRVTVVPPDTTVADIMRLQPDGVLFSNGPGDPAQCVQGIELARALLEQSSLPLFGICLGHQILGHALGANSIKLKAGHHGANHPVQELATGKVYITSQNHGYALDEQSFTPDMALTHISLFDRSVQGFKHKHRPVFGFQGHPEATPGPRDITVLFDQFIDTMTPSPTA